jgi:hypothetical protein
MHADRPDVCASAEDYQTPAGYAIAMAVLAADGQSEGQIGAESGCFDCEYAIEPEPGGSARREGIEFLADAVDTLPDYRVGARIIVRNVTYGPWRYGSAQEIINELTVDDE